MVLRKCGWTVRDRKIGTWILLALLGVAVILGGLYWGADLKKLF